MAHKVEIWKDGQRRWRWRVRAANGKIVATSGENFASRRNARRAWSALSRALRAAPGPASA